MIILSVQSSCQPIKIFPPDCTARDQIDFAQLGTQRKIEGGGRKRVREKKRLRERNKKETKRLR